MTACDGFGKAGIKRLRTPSALRNPPLMPRPWISTNLAISADGKISSPHRHPSGWTSQEDLQRLRHLRESADAILVGRGTLVNDRMTMTAPQNPLRCIVSQTGSISPSHPVFSTPGGPVHLLVTGEANPPELPGITVHHENASPAISGSVIEPLSASRLRPSYRRASHRGRRGPCHGQRHGHRGRALRGAVWFPRTHGVRRKHPAHRAAARSGKISSRLQ